jgi:exopolysaccharide biosynthesis operon protein EpsL
MKGLDLARLLLGLLMFVAVGASGATNDVITITAGITELRDDNVFRRPSDGSFGVAAGDRVTTTQIGFAIRKPISLQTFELSATTSDNRHESFTALNSRNDSYLAAWRWQMTPHLTGDLSSDRQQSQTDFADFRGTGQNLRTTENRRFDAYWNFLGGWTLGAGATEAKTTNSQPFLQDPGNDQRIADVTLKYSFSSGTLLTLSSSKNNSDYHRQADPATYSDSKSTDRRDELRLDWSMTRKTRLAANYGRVSRKHENFSVRDYAGHTGAVSISWAATGKTNFTFSHANATESWEDSFSSFAIRKTTSLSGDLQASAKILFRASIDRETRAFDGFGVIPLAYSRFDKTGRESVSLNWAALKNQTISGSIQKSRRRSKSPGFDYDARLATVSATASF